MNKPTDHFDAVVIGAGPAGSIAARQVAAEGASVLLVDRAEFPRQKVCGCCVNAAAVTALAELGLAQLFDTLKAKPLNAFEWQRGKKKVRLSLPDGYSVSRASFDQTLVDAAIAAGVHFRDQTAAVETEVHSDHRIVKLVTNGVETTVSANVVIDAGGLASSLCANIRDIQTTVTKNSYMGVSTFSPTCPSAIEAGVIYMADGPGGYVGMVRLEDDQLDIAAAVAPEFVQSHAGVGEAVQAIVTSASSLPDLAWKQFRWRGTGLLTQSRTPPAATRLFLIGDAAGYVEPFTGEGIAWAIASGRAVVPHAMKAIRSRQSWNAQAVTNWQQSHAELLKTRQARCRNLTRLLRGKFATAGVMRLLSVFPSLATPMLRKMSRAFELPVPPTNTASAVTHEEERVMQ